MGTRSLILTDDEWRALAILVNNQEHDADQRRVRAPWPGSPMEKSAEADQKFWQDLQAKMAGRVSVTPAG